MKLALAQMEVVGGEPVVNLANAEAQIGDASLEGADALLFPEALNCGWTHPSARTEAQPIPQGLFYQGLADRAKRHGIWVCAGLIELDGDRLYNSAVLIDPAGELRLKHRKINELDIARGLYSLGSADELSVCETPFGKIGIHICADAFADGQWISRALCNLGAGIILSPCAWAVDADHDIDVEPYGDLWRHNYRPVCEEYEATIAGCSSVGKIEAGPWAGRKCIGNSIVIDHSGTEILTGPCGENADRLLFLEIPSVSSA